MKKTAKNTEHPVIKQFGINVSLVTAVYGASRLMARVSGASPQTLDNIKQGRQKGGCRLVTAHEIAKFSGCTIDDLLLPTKKFLTKIVAKRLLGEQIARTAQSLGCSVQDLIDPTDEFVDKQLPKLLRRGKKRGPKKKSRVNGKAR